MKGIAHFAVGVAVATFFPEVVQAAASHGGLGPALGGVAGLLPDTLDFKLLRYLHRADVVLDPARLALPSGEPDAQALAEGLAAAAERAHATGEPVRARLHTLQLGGDRWRRWRVRFDEGARCVVVEVGPVVTTGQVAVAGSGARVEPGRAPVTAPVHGNYGQEIVVDIFAGPDVTFRPRGEWVEADFLPWHRAWTHSLLAALLVGLAGWLVGPVYGLVMALALLAHVAVDQLGQMGSNLWAPLTRRRTPGLGLVHSGDPLPNLLTVWVSGAVALLNLDRFSGSPLLPVWPYLIVSVGMPCLAAMGWRGWTRQRGASAHLPATLDPVEEAGALDI
ncbi:MAG: metal-dependent hydrolase [Anaerolineae bacterium]|nr:metal-dependent hydrolase [Anaerolineae bacterium]